MLLEFPLFQSHLLWHYSRYVTDKAVNRVFDVMSMYVRIFLSAEWRGVLASYAAKSYQSSTWLDGPLGQNLGPVHCLVPQ
ncbi:hypothetical protein BHE74_00053157 [Ensete ventricosum]|nr:hypothetical protein BHE74_00053157 [Ensete ventricosum]